MVVRINDRGPFHADRVIDVSYTAALKLGLLGQGSKQVEIERLFPGDQIHLADARRAAASEAQAAPAEIATMMLEDEVALESAAMSSPSLLPDRPAAKPASSGMAAGFYLQLGAYGRDGKAEAMRSTLLDAGVAQNLAVEHAGPVNRLVSGPYDSRAAAQAAARALPLSLGLKPLVVKR